MNKKDFFSKYKRSSLVRRPDDIFKQKLTREALGNLNKSQDAQKSDYCSATSSNPYPHLQAYIERGMGKRLSKKF
jgi:hypothetical protein